MSEGDITGSAALKMDITKLQIGIETEVEQQVENDVNVSSYVNASISGYFLGFIYQFATGGNFSTSPAPGYAK